jgi:mannose/fructose/N-acetylgalactosamine-specific phosphotransferase system component IIC
VNLQVLGTLLLGGVAALDSAPVAQTLFSQPLVTATVLGALWGQWHLALEVGVVLQILAASTLPVGARTPEDYAVGGVVGTGVALAVGARQPFAMAQEAAALGGTIAGLVAATGGVALVKWQRRRNEGLSRWCEAEVRRGQEGALGTAQRAGVVLAFAVGVGYSAVCLAVGVALLGPWVEHYSLRLAHAWTLAHPLWLGLGLAQLVRAFARQRLARAALFAASLLGAWILLMVGGR